MQFNFQDRIKANELHGVKFPFGVAVEFAKQGIPVSREGWLFREAMSGHVKESTVHADNIWAPANKKAALKNADKSLIVKPYLTKNNGVFLETYTPTNEDIYNQWMLHSTFPRLTGLVDGEDDGDLFLTFDFVQDEKPHHPFWMLYDQDMIGYSHPTVIITNNEKRFNLFGNIIKLMGDYVNYRQLNEEESNLLNIDDDLIDDETYQFLNPELDTFEEALAEILGSLDEYNNLNIIVDLDALVNLTFKHNGENVVEYITGILANNLMLTEHTWACVSIEEQKQYSF